MSLNKRIKGDYIIESIDSGDTITLHQAGGITIDGDLIVTGTNTTVNTTDVTITDNIIVLNSGEVGAGITAGSAGIEIDRGSEPDVRVRYNETSDRWEATDDGSAYYGLDIAGSGVTDLINDLSPQLGADLDVNGFSITSAGSGNIVLVASGTGLVKIDQDLSFLEQVTDETSTASYNKIYAKATGVGGTGLFMVNSTTTDELVSKKKALAFGILF